jgi:hypothetical protein
MRLIASRNFWRNSCSEAGGAASWENAPNAAPGEVGAAPLKHYFFGPGTGCRNFGSHYAKRKSNRGSPDLTTYDFTARLHR